MTLQNGKRPFPRRTTRWVVSPGHMHLEAFLPLSRESLNRSSKDLSICRLDLTVHIGSCLPLLGQWQRIQVFGLNTHLSRELLHAVKLHRPNSLQNSITPIAELHVHLVLFLLTQASIPQLVDDPATHEILDPHAHVRMETAPTLSLHRTKKGLHDSKETRCHQPSTSAVRQAIPKVDVNPNAMLQVQANHEIREDRLSKWIFCHTAKHLLFLPQIRVVLFQKPPSSNFVAFVEQLHHSMLRVCDIWSGENQGCAPQQTITKALMTKQGPVSIGPDDMVHTQVQSPQGCFHAPGHCLILQDFRHGCALPTQFHGVQKVLRRNLTQVLQALLPRLLVSKEPGRRNVPTATPKTIKHREQISIASPTRRTFSTGRRRVIANAPAVIVMSLHLGRCSENRTPCRATL